MRILVTGGHGQVGSEVVAELDRRNSDIKKGSEITVVVPTSTDLDVSRRDAVFSWILDAAPDVVIHSAAFTQVDACEEEVDRAFAVNALGTRFVQEAARVVGAHVVYVSTDYVFDGRSPNPYREWDQTNPLSVYGASKLGGEHELDPGATIARTSWVCGAQGGNMVKTILRLNDAGNGPLRFVNDQRGCPTFTRDLARCLIDLGMARRSGVFHVTNQGETTWYEFARSIIQYAAGDPSRVEPITTAELDPPRPAPRPANSVLDNAALRLSGLHLLPNWQESAKALVAELIH